MLRSLIARAFWLTSRWTLRTQPAPAQPTILIGAPHTSNWDFVFMLGIAWRLGIDVRWLGKKSLFASWRRPLMRGLGGIPVDRADPGTVVRDMVQRVRDGEMFGLVVTPDGTRKGQTHWKSGFYRIARETGLPLTLGYVDRTTMTTGLGPTIHLTGDVAADMERTREFYADKAGFHPQHRVEPRLRDEPGLSNAAGPSTEAGLSREAGPSREAGLSDSAEATGPGRLPDQAGTPDDAGSTGEPETR
jgi:1-acyl-sn-glycerol-3-phosphate acyltransferase